MNLEITKITISRIPENKGHIGFASCIINNKIKLNNIAIFKRLNNEGYRLVFPEKKINDKKIQLFFPVNSEAYFELESAVNLALK